MSTIQWIVTSTKLLINKEQSNNTSLRLDPDKCLALAFAGSPATFLERSEYHQLSPTEIAFLKSCNIDIESTHYVNGLVKVQLRTTNRVPDLLSLKCYLESTVLSLLADPSDVLCSKSNELWTEYSDTRQRLNTILETDAESEKIIEILLELKNILTEVGCLFLPKDFLNLVKNTKQFLDNVAPNVGLYVISLIAVDKNAP